MASRRKPRVGSLAGWLFADLTLLLCFVFFDSSVSGTGSGLKPNSPTTTLSKAATSKQGVRPLPVLARVRANKSTSGKELVKRLESELGKKAEGKKFLVVLARGGSNGVDSSRGDELSRIVVTKLENEWSRIVKGVTYFDTGHDNSAPFGYLILKLFPIQDDALSD